MTLEITMSARLGLQVNEVAFTCNRVLMLQAQQISFDPIYLANIKHAIEVLMLEPIMQELDSHP